MVALIQKNFLLCLLLSGFIAATMYFVVTNGIEKHYKNETLLAETSINSADTLIRRYLDQLRSDVAHFTAHNQYLLQQVVDEPDDDHLYLSILNKINAYFPKASTFTLSDAQGHVLLEDKGDLIGKGCRENIRLFAISPEQSDSQLRIHSDRQSYHFDIMHQMHMSDGRVMVFFVSFTPEDIARVLETLQLPGHNLYIIKQNSNGLIEITEQGARVELKRHTSLVDDEFERILIQKDIESTLWQLIDIIDTGKLKQVRVDVYRDASMVFLAFLAGVILTYLCFFRDHRP